MKDKIKNLSFIEKAKQVHGEKYDYSKVIYTNNRNKIQIICPTHGEFNQRPCNHLLGRGCHKCKNEVIAKSKTKTKIDFLTEVKKIHGDKYDYSKTEYVNTKNKVTIICLKHGEFKQLPDNHLKGKGCPMCNGKNKTTDLIIQDFITIHGDKYDYQKVIYSGIKNKVVINCPIHGLFKQSPEEHLKGCGCPICKESKGEKQIRKILIDKQINYIPQHKFKNCKNILELPFDFYLPEHNICIEFQGIQHFKPVSFFGGINKFKKTIANDEVKRQYCINNNIKLITINYNDDVLLYLSKIF